MALFSPVFQQFFDNNGNPLAGGKLYTYEAGTTTNKVTYTSEDETTANSNPIILDAGGRADIWLDSGSYKLVLDDSTDVLVDQIDNITGAAANVFGSSVVDVAVNTNVTSVFQNNVIRTTATPITLTLLPAATAGEGFLFSVKNTSAGANTIDPDAAELIDGASTLTLGSGQSTLIVCDGTGWTSLFISDVGLADDNTFTGDNTFDEDITAPNTFKTGDMKPTIRNTADTGWILLDDGNIGNAASSATTRANADTEDLFTLLWNNVGDTYAPVSSGRGASAAADYAANKTIGILTTLGHAIGVAGAGSGLTSRALGENLGDEDTNLTTAQLASHSHGISNLTTALSGTGQTGALQEVAGTVDQIASTNGTNSAGSGDAHTNMQPTFFVNVMIKL